MSDLGNELLNDCRWFAEKHRGKNKQSGPHWSIVIRFPKLFDEAVRLQKRVDVLESYIDEYAKAELLERDISPDGAKRCPFCGDFPSVWTFEGGTVVECKNESCPLYYEFSGSIFLDVWNDRAVFKNVKSEDNQ